jgi:hypothetical protein
MRDVEDRYEFANGWVVIVHGVKDGQVYFQRWPPGVNDQPVEAPLCRMPIAEFLDAVNKQRESGATHA